MNRTVLFNGVELNPRMIQGKVFVSVYEEPVGSVIRIKTNRNAVLGKVYMSGKAPEGETQLEEGNIVQYSLGGQKVQVGAQVLTFIDYKQVLYIYP